ncbi:hypothetical protein CANINC_000032 [Pichia inconspicua]|uniref:GATA-type domain-containing protein n=1 Tax=Pichia inconspicua TaxID=52247 RepID=A0A4T0X7P9_9ASCO|nr:hypothetical protein CANINC_000032 [[Candida] inconspicua]
MQVPDLDENANQGSATTLWRILSKIREDDNINNLLNSHNNTTHQHVSNIQDNTFNSKNVNELIHPRPIDSEFDYLDHIKSLSTNESYLSKSNNRYTKTQYTKVLRQEILSSDNKQQPSKLSQTFQNHHLVSSPRDSQYLRNLTQPSSSHSFSQLNSASFSNTPSATAISRGDSYFNIHEELDSSGLSHSASPAISNTIYLTDIVADTGNYSTSVPNAVKHSHSSSEANTLSLLDQSQPITKSSGDINFHNFLDSPNDHNIKHDLNVSNIDYFDFNNNRELSINHNLKFDLDGDINMFDTIHTIHSNNTPHVTTNTPTKPSNTNLKSQTSIKNSKKATTARRKSTSKKRKPEILPSMVATPVSSLNSSSALSTPTQTSNQSPMRPASTTSENVGDNEISCTNCHTKTTPLWRRNPEGQPLCNACGLFLKLHGVVRPLSLKTDVIKKRQRGGSTTKKKKGQLTNIKLDGDDLNPTPITREDGTNIGTDSSNSEIREQLKLKTEISSQPDFNNTSFNNIENHTLMKPMFSLNSPDNFNNSDSIFNENFDMSIVQNNFIPNNYASHSESVQDQKDMQTIHPDTQTHNDEKKEQNWDWLNMEI